MVGERVTLAVRSADGVHGIEIKKVKVSKEIPRGAAPVMIEFTATEAGRFPIVCSEYCGDGHDDMKGTLVVKARDAHTLGGEMHVYRYMAGAALLAVSIGSAACDESLPSITGPTPNLVPTFTSIQNEIFSNGDSSGRVACTQCHNAIGRLFNGLDLSPAGVVCQPGRASPAAARLGAVRVIAGDPENSYLIHKLEGRPGIVGRADAAHRAAVSDRWTDTRDQALDRAGRAQRLGANR